MESGVEKVQGLTEGRHVTCALARKKRERVSGEDGAFRPSSTHPISLSPFL